MHGEYSCARYPQQKDRDVNGSAISHDVGRSVSEWKTNPDGSIPCPPKCLGGCESAILELRTTFPDDRVSNLVKNVKVFLKTYKVDMPIVSEQGCSCFTSKGVDLINNTIRKAASRDNACDNYLYSPNGPDIHDEDLKHFQYHWIKGEPVIVSNVLETTSGLSWEPMVMWRAFRQITNIKHGQHLDVTAIDCLDWAEVSYLCSLILSDYTEAIK